MTLGERAHQQVLDPETRSRFEALAVPHLGHLYRLAVRLKRGPQDAEDLVQETYVKALRAFPALRDPERIRPWLCQILSRLVYDGHRTEPREVAVGDLEELDRFSLYDLIDQEDPFPYSDQLHRDFLAHFDDGEVRRALLALPEAYRCRWCCSTSRSRPTRSWRPCSAARWARSCRACTGDGRFSSASCGSAPSSGES